MKAKILVLMAVLTGTLSFQLGPVVRSATSTTMLFDLFGKKPNYGGNSSPVIGNKPTGPNNMPKLYDAWFKKSGQMSKLMTSSAKSALSKHRQIEIFFNPVPNLDEIDFGTPLNQEFGKEMAVDLGLPEYKPGSLARRYLLQFSQIYWAKQLAQALPGNIYVATLDGLKKDVITKPGKMKLANFVNGKGLENVQKGDTVIVVNPGGNSVWNKADKMFQDQKVVYLNSLVTETYDLGGPLKDLEQSLYFKRISKGYVLRVFPNKWEVYLDKPDFTTEKLAVFDEKPKLREASKLTMQESMERYGVNNDRWAAGFGGRL